MRPNPKGKSRKMEAESGGSAILKEVISSYEDLSCMEVIFIHKIHAGFLAPLAVGQQAYVMAHCLSYVHPSVNFSFKHLLL